MKVFVQAKNESLVINGEIIVTVLDVNDDNVILAVDAPEWVEVCEQETFERSETHAGSPPLNGADFDTESNPIARTSSTAGR